MSVKDVSHKKVQKSNKCDQRCVNSINQSSTKNNHILTIIVPEIECGTFS